MRKRLIKITAIQQVIVMILTVLISLFTVMQTNSVAKDVDYNLNYSNLKNIINTCNYINTRKKVPANSGWGIAKTPAYRIYVNTDAIANRAAYEYTLAETSNGASDVPRLSIDAGVTFYVVPTEWATDIEKGESKVDSYKYEVEVMSQTIIDPNSNSCTSFGTYTGIEPIRITQSAIEAVTEPGTQSVTLLIKINKFSTAYPYVKINKETVLTYEVTVELNTIKVENSSKSNVIEENNIIYARLGTTINFTTDWKTSRTGTRKSGTIGSFSGNNSSITASKYLGTRSTVTWGNSYGSSTTRYMYASNLATEKYDVIYGNTEAINETRRYGYSTYYNTVRKIGAKMNADTDIQIMQKQKYSNVAIASTNVSVTDMTGCLSKTPTITSSGKTAIITLNAKSEGVIKVTFTDYKGDTHSEYWYVFKCDNTAVINKPSPETTEPSNDDTQTPSAPTNAGGTSGDNGAQIPQPVAPSINFSSSSNGNERTVNVTITNCTAAKYAIVKRTNESVCQALNYTYNNFSGTGVANPSSFTITFNTKDYTDGKYDVVVYALNGTTQNQSAIGPYSLGPSSTIKEPEFTGFTTVAKSEASKETTITTKNCTQVKYKVIKRTNKDVAYTFGNETYDSFDGKVVSSPSSFKVSTSSFAKGSGYYDIAVWGINQSSSVCSKVVYGAIKVVNTPIVNIYKIPVNEKDSYKTYGVNVVAFGESTKCYYYLHRKDSATTYSQPRIVTLKGENKAVSPDVWGEYTGNGQTIILNTETIGAGYWDLTVYAENDWGRYAVEHIDNIVISNAPDVEYTIENEDADAKSSISIRDEKNINVIVNDIDGNDKITIDYIVSDTDFTENGEKAIDNTVFEENATMVKRLAVVNSNDTSKITVKAEKGETASKYVYIRATDKYGVSTFLRTGSIYVDNTDLKLQSIYADKKAVEDEKVGYGVGKFKLTYQFNRYMTDVCPDVYVKFGEYEVKQEKITVNKNEITYQYNIPENSGNGDIVISRIDYTNNTFTSNDATPKTYNKQISEDEDVIDFVTGKYFVDSIKPVAESLQIEIITDEEQSKIYPENPNLETDTIYVSNIKEANIVVTYSEPVQDESAMFGVFFGDKASFFVVDHTTEERTVQKYSITNLVNENMENNKYGGDLVIKYIFTTTDFTEDKAGNSVKWDKNLLLPNVKYTLNGNEIGENAKIVLDSTIYNSEIYSGSTRIEEDSTYTTGTEFTVFAEFNRKENCFDDSGIEDVKFELQYSNNGVNVLDKSGNVLLPTDIEDIEEDSYNKVAKYELEQSDLPISLKIEDEGDYLLRTSKEDILENSTEKEVVITAKNLIQIDKEKSGIDSDETTYYNIFRLEEEALEYSLVLKLDSVSSDDISVLKVDNSIAEKIDYVSSETEDGYEYATYKFIATRGGRYNIQVKNADSQIVLNDSVKLGNVYTPGDLNYDGYINTIDLTYLLRYLAGIYSGREIALPANIDGKDGVTLADAILLAKAIAGLPSVERDIYNGGYFRIVE